VRGEVGLRQWRRRLKVVSTTAAFHLSERTTLYLPISFFINSPKSQHERRDFNLLQPYPNPTLPTSSMSPPPHPIPLLYRFIFTILDPLLATTGIFTTFFLPSTFLKSYFPHPTLTPETRLCTDGLTGFFASILVLQLVLLPMKSRDVGVWKTVQAAIVLTDFGLLAGFVREGRLSPGSWTVMEWGNLVILGGAAVVRLSFLAGVGFSKQKAKA